MSLLIKKLNVSVANLQFLWSFLTIANMDNWTGQTFKYSHAGVNLTVN